MKIRKLEFIEENGFLICDTPLSRYTIYTKGRIEIVHWEGGEWKHCGTVELAKQAAQEDFERRVKACFETDNGKSNFWG